MNRNRTTQLIALIVMIACLVGASFLVNPINQQRAELQLEAGVEAGEALPPHIALATAALGGFRGLLVDILWYRANELKEDGKFYEANTLSQWITSLQPRFPQVWAFHSWNMAYNISVATHTQEERWDWVYKGVKLLRERGVPLNPRAIRLYRELSWIFFHKIGQYSDDMHWYYKRELAYEMQEVLGDIDRGGTTEQVLARFKVIADAPDSLEELLEESPECGPLLNKLGELGYEADEKLLQQFGRIIIFTSSLDAALLGWRNTRDLPPGVDGRLGPVVGDPQLSKGLRPLIAYLRKHVLIDYYRMDPVQMYELMEMYGPMDWRHSASHGAYWAFVGTKMAKLLRDDSEVDLINTYRQNIHSLQTLTREGRITFDPISRHIDQMPDPRFIPSYETNLERAKEAYKEQTGNESDSYSSGHENFLLQAITYSYLYGDEEQAKYYYDKVRRLYGEKPHNVRTGRYLQPLESLVLGEFTENADMKDRSRQFIDAMIRRGIERGLLNGDRRVWERFLKLAKEIHTRHQKRGISTPTADQDRMKFLPWDEMLESTYMGFMRQQSIAPLIRARVWANTPEKLRRDTYLKLRELMREQLKEAGLHPDLAFRAPRGMEDAELPTVKDDKKDSEEKAPTSIQRN